jgi:glycosyltransferase involved in cell wall biosynthesis
MVDLVSVVIPTYGRPEFLLDAVCSVADQTYASIELIVVGTSTL